ncbi:MAG: type II toxin-antitoxin system RelB/DinJ family antitoxin [Oscillospiraceae bacterium]|jgi:DNA-damage-inducible protein J|nr:type II toxin-antitoxin system RelB/DinJ family antitoxin [Oscillospiraceae bacterium]
MAKTASLNIRIDPNTKSSAEALFGQFGITVADAVSIFLNKAIMEGGLPFEMRQPRYNAETEAAIQESRDIMSGKIQAKAYASFGEFLADLEHDDDADV